MEKLLCMEKNNTKKFNEKMLENFSKLVIYT